MAWKLAPSWLGFQTSISVLVNPLSSWYCAIFLIMEILIISKFLFSLQCLPNKWDRIVFFDTLILRFNVSCCVFVLLVQPYVIYIISVLSQISKNYVYPDQKQDLTVTKSASKSSIILNRLTKITTLIKSVKT